MNIRGLMMIENFIFQVIRSGGVGAASTVARVGALVAPFVPLLVCI